MKYIQNTTRALLLALMLIQCGEDESLTAKKKYKQALASYHQKKLGLALKGFLQVNKAEPGYKHTNLYIGKIHYYNTDFEKAQIYFETYSKYHPDNQQGQLWLIKTKYIRKKTKPQELLTLIDKYLELNSTDLEVLYTKARLLQGMRRTSEALLTYRQITENDYFIKASYLQLAEIYKNNKLPQKAKRYIRIAKTLHKQQQVTPKEATKQKTKTTNK